MTAARSRRTRSASTPSRRGSPCSRPRRRSGALAQRRRRRATACDARAGVGRRDPLGASRSRRPRAPSARRAAPAASVVVHLARRPTTAARAVADGRYTATLPRRDDAGNQRATHVHADRRHDARRRSPRPRRPPCSRPNGDGALDTTRLVLVGQRAGVRARRDLPRDDASSGRGRSRAATVGDTWNGRGADGRRVPDGRYALQLDVRRTPAATARLVRRRSSSTARAGVPALVAGLLPTGRRTTCRRARPSTLTLARDAKTTLRLYDAGGRARAHRLVGARRSADGRPPAGPGTGGSPTGRHVAAGAVRGAARGRPRRWARSCSRGRCGSPRSPSTPSATTVKAGPDPAGRVRDHRAARGTAGRHVQAAGPGGGLGDRDAARPTASYLASFKVRPGRAGPAAVRISARRTPAAGVNRTTVAIRVVS